MSIIVELPFPDSNLMPNRARRQHWRSKAGYAQIARMTAKVEAYNAKPRYDYAFPLGERIPLTLRFYPPNHKARDLDNLLAAMKPSIDGICDSLEINDKMFCPITLDWGKVEKGGRVVVEIGKVGDGK
jgi:crossover junction endodeoxyribonuclease RusA